MRAALALVAATLVSACANGDFGRVKSSLVLDDVHSWVGAEAAKSAGIPASTFPLTENERLLRDLAYPLIEPPFDRQRFYSILNEYGISRIFIADWGYYDVHAYHGRLSLRFVRSAEAQYAQLIDDVRNDADRIPIFADVARRVFDIDAKREKSLAYVANLTPAERHNALARISENALVAAWVERSLVGRLEAYRYTLERLVIAQPISAAVAAETAINLMRHRMAENRLNVRPIAGLVPIKPRPPRAAAGS